MTAVCEAPTTLNPTHDLNRAAYATFFAKMTATALILIPGIQEPSSVQRGRRSNISEFKGLKSESDVGTTRRRNIQTTFYIQSSFI